MRTRFEISRSGRNRLSRVARESIRNSAMQKRLKTLALRAATKLVRSRSVRMTIKIGRSKINDVLVRTFLQQRRYQSFRPDPVIMSVITDGSDPRPVRLISKILSCSPECPDVVCGQVNISLTGRRRIILIFPASIARSCARYNYCRVRPRRTVITRMLDLKHSLRARTN